jgi:hypothetical protein
MKRFLLLAWMLVMAVPSMAEAGRADHFKGVYDILTPTYPENPGRHFMLVDTDTLANIWATYSKTELPADLVPFKEEPTIIVGFNDRDTLFLTFEKGALITPAYLSIMGAQGKQLELKRNGDGSYDAAVQEFGQVSKLHLAAPVPLTPPEEPETN